MQLSWPHTHTIKPKYTPLRNLQYYWLMNSNEKSNSKSYLTCTASGIRERLIFCTEAIHKLNMKKLEIQLIVQVKL